MTQTMTQMKIPVEAKPAVLPLGNNNDRIIAVFQELGLLYEKEQNHQAAATYKKVCTALRGLAFEITTENAKGLCKGKDKVPDIGKASADRIHEFLATGKLGKLEEKRVTAHG
jgi:DNA polymerase/3'-5' exonuclease PolX